MELRVPHILHLFNAFRENKDSDNCAKVLEEECIKMFATKSLNDENVRNVVSMNSLNIHDANDIQSRKLGDAMFNEDDIFSLLSFDMQIYYGDSMPLIYDDESRFGRVSTLGSNDPTIFEGFESYCDNYKIEFGEVMTLFSDESTILEEVSIDYDENKVATYDDYYDDMYVMSTTQLYSCRHVLGLQE